MKSYPPAWSVLRCTPYESLQVRMFGSQYEAKSACKTLERMSSSEVGVWYEVAELTMLYIAPEIADVLESEF